MGEEETRAEAGEVEETMGEDNDAKEEGEKEEEQYEEEAKAEAEEQTEERRFNVTTAKNRPRTYLQEWAFGKWKLVVEVSEAMTYRQFLSLRGSTRP